MSVVVSRTGDLLNIDYNYENSYVCMIAEGVHDNGAV